MDRFKKVIPILLYILFILFTVFVIFGAFVERFLMDNWGDLAADEVVYHLKSSLQGTEPGMVRDAIIRYGIPAFVVIALIIGILIALRKNKRYRRGWIAIAVAAEIICLLTVKGELDKRMNFTNYVKWQLFGYNSNFIEENYVDPGKVELEFPEQKRNLIYIFLESMETTYADAENGGAFERNVIPELTELAQENEDFSGSDPALDGGYALPGTTWTMGAMFAMATGAPLKVPVSGNSIKDEEHFFPGMKSLGTVLQDQGYRQELLIGSKATFGGRDIFYKSHGGFEIHDYTQAIKSERIPKDYKVFWGIEDEKLFAFAKEDLKSLSESGEPFNLTMLTVDTHFEDGYHCRLCRDDFGEQYADAFACSSRQVTEFVKWVQEQDFYENTTIVLCGDHLTMDRDFCDNVSEDYPRKTYVAVINGKGEDSGKKQQERREYSTLDMFPTTLAAMGVKIPGNRLGLGVNLYSDEKTIVEEYGLKKCETELEMPSSFMDEMSGIKITEEILQTVYENALIYADELGGGKVELTLYKLGTYLNYKSILQMEVEITNKATGETETILVKPTFKIETDVNKYMYKCDIDVGSGKLEDYDVAYYITAGDFKHYKIADLENNRGYEIPPNY